MGRENDVNKQVLIIEYMRIRSNRRSKINDRIGVGISKS